MTAQPVRRQAVVRGEAPWWLLPSAEVALSGPAGAELRELGRAGAPVKAARDFTAATLDGWGLTELSADARLVVSELVTNAMRHAGEPGGLRLFHRSSHLVCAVFDPAERPPVMSDTDDFAESGRGLWLVDNLCSSWGWHLLDGHGKLVWACLLAPYVTRHRTPA
ncbi:ATP-binding protein [Sphaerisporangium aureirubrum]|uniref:ATP-binding protein n=1 Tax=Sphaerisporangium aureirubrum TaxID=1544736 RepID=A0ABW1N9X5_9ACTN